MSPTYDVFLSHSNADKPAVETLALKLRKAGIEPFLDKWHLIPGDPWQEGLEEALDASRTCAVFLGPKGLGGWQNEEMRSALDDRVRDKTLRVIPVLLPGSFEPRKEDLPRFLRRLTWVDFRGGLDDEDAFHRLLNGIRGQAPGPGGGGGPAKLAHPLRCMAQPPEGWIHRREYDEVLEALCSKEGVQAGRSVGITTALRGAGGFGKTALAQKLCFDDRVRETYPDGILWATMGEDITESGRLSRIRDLIRWWTQEEAPAFESVAAAGAHLRDRLVGSRVLVVVDDAWKSADVTPFQGLGEGSALLVTTRVAQALPEASLSIPVDAMASSEAISLLGLGLQDAPRGEVGSLATRLGEWALLLKLVNGTLRKFVKGGLTVLEAFQRVHEDLDVEGFSAFDQNDSESRHAAASKTILVSTKSLSEKERDLFFDLAIFPEDEDIPLSVSELYWGLNRSATRKLCDHLYDLSLLRAFDQKQEFIRLHDVTRQILMEQRREVLSALHRRLLDLSRPASGEWKDLPEEETYLWKRLAYHLLGAGKKNELRALLLSFPFLSSKLKVTDINSLIGEYDPFVGEVQELRLIQAALRLSAHVLTKDPAQLASQLLGRLLGQNEPALHAFLEEARSWQESVWLRPRIGSLAQAGGALVRTLEGHMLAVTAVVVFADGHIVSGSNDKTLRVWNLESGQTFQTLEGHKGVVTAVTVLEDGLIVSGSNDKTLRVWNLESRQLLQTLEGHKGVVTAVAVLEDGLIVSGSNDKTLRVWNLESGQTLQILKGHKRAVTTVTVLEDSRIVSGSSDGTLRIWDIRSGQTLQTLEGHTGRVTAVVVLEGGRIVSGSSDGTLRVWDIGSSRTLQILEGHMGRITAAAALEGGRIVSGSSDGTLRVWNFNSGQILQTLQGHTGQALAVAVLRGGRIVSGSSDGTLRVWDFDSGQTPQTLQGHTNRVSAVAVLGDGRAVSGSFDKTLRVWDLGSGQLIQTLQGHTDMVNTVAVLDDGRVVSGSDDETLRVWDLESGQALQILQGYPGWVLAVAILAGGGAVSASDFGTLRVWDLGSGQALQILEGHTEGVNAVAVLAGGRAVSGSDDKTLRVWDLESGQTLKILQGHMEEVTAVVMLSRNHIVSGSWDRTLRVWASPGIVDTSKSPIMGDEVSHEQDTE